MSAIGLIGIGTMGAAMALRLLGAGRELVVWNRTVERCASVAAQGARVAASVDDVFAAAEHVIVMLANIEAIDAALGRGGAAFDQRVRGKTLINMGTILPAASAALAADVERASGVYVEAPVSGSRVPAERGQLVVMLAGPAAALSTVRDIVQPLCKQIVACGAVPNALATKISVNVVLVSQLAAFAESVHLARRSGVDLTVLAEVLLNGPMANDLMRIKLPKLLANDFAPQASLRDVHYNTALILSTGADANAALPLSAACEQLYRACNDAGLSALDVMAAVGYLDEMAGSGWQTADGGRPLAL